MIHRNEEEAINAINKFAEIIKQAEKETGASFFAEALDDYGMEYFIDASYLGSDKKIKSIKIHFQSLGL